MNLFALKDGESIEVGDRIRPKHGLGENWFTVTRVGKKYAFAKVNDVAETKVNRVYKEFGFSTLPRQKWQTTQYTVWRGKK